MRATAVVVALTLLSGIFLAVPGRSAQAASPQVPTDVRFVSSWTDPLTGLHWDRYQQYAAPLGVFVDGAQLIVIGDGTRVDELAGAHYEGLRVATWPALTANQAIAAATAHSTMQAPSANANTSPSELTRSAQLRVNPDSGRQFYRVSSWAPGSLLYQDVDADSGAVIQSWSGIEYADPPGTGRGVKGDLKNLAGSDALAGADVLTSGTWPYQMASADNEYLAIDDNNASSSSYPATPLSDADNIWSSSREAAAVDAQYYAALTDNFYTTRFGFDLNSSQCLNGPIRSIVHYSRSYANAFWDPDAKVMVYGDGDGSTYAQMSGAQDVVSHELSHAVTSCNSNLDYLKESGALNEAFSDIMGTAAEFLSQEPNSSNCIRESGQSSCADWWLGEDLVLSGADHAFRSLANPELLGQPSHYADRVYKTSCSPSQFNDYCGVHTNSGIANHSFYLLAQGGRNARCSGPTDTEADCDVLVPGIGVDHAANIYYRAWLNLPINATFCQARDWSVWAAQYLANNVAGYSSADVSATDSAWRAVGVHQCTTGFRLGPAATTVFVNPGGTADLPINVFRSTSTDPITFSTSDPSPATASFSPNPGTVGDDATSLHLEVPVDAEQGIFDLMISGTDGATSAQAAVTLVVDSQPPTVAVESLGMATASKDVVGADGHVPLHVTWSASDATSGVASGSLTADSTPLATGTGGSATFSSVDGSHSFEATATDVAGNVAQPSTLSISQSSVQETPTAGLVYKKTWSAYNAGSAWGNTRFSKTHGATAAYTFNGTDIAWVSMRGPKRGRAKVYIDGVLKAIVDLYSASSSTRRIVFVAGGLAAGQHTIQIYVNGTSGRPRVDVDGFVVLSP